MARTNFSWGAAGKGTEGVDYGNTNNWNDSQWNDYENKYGIAHPDAAPAAPPTGSFSSSQPAAPINTAAQVTSGTANVGQNPAQGAPTTIAQSFQQSLINRLNPAPVDASNAAIAPSIQANDLALQRGAERGRNLLAERNAVNNGGTTSGGFDTQLLGLEQDRAAQSGQFAGNAVQQLQQQQNANQNSAMGLAGSLLTGQQGLSQQMDLANLDAELRRAGLAQQGSLGSQDLALRDKLGSGQLNLGLLTSLLGNDYNNRALGQNASQFGQQLDQQGLMGLLGLL